MRLLVAAAAVVAAAVVAAGPGTAATNPSGTGQPSQTCLSSTAPNEPGSSANASGSAFNENGGTAGGVYAGNQPQSSTNPKSVAQYDVACYQVSQH